MRPSRKPTIYGAHNMTHSTVQYAVDKYMIFIALCKERSQPLFIQQEKKKNTGCMATNPKLFESSVIT